MDDPGRAAGRREQASALLQRATALLRLDPKQALAASEGAAAGAASAYNPAEAVAATNDALTAVFDLEAAPPVPEELLAEYTSGVLCAQCADPALLPHFVLPGPVSAARALPDLAFLALTVLNAAAARHWALSPPQARLVLIRLVCSLALWNACCGLRNGAPLLPDYLARKAAFVLARIACLDYAHFNAILLSYACWVESCNVLNSLAAKSFVGSSLSQSSAAGQSSGFANNDTYPGPLAPDEAVATDSLACAAAVCLEVATVVQDEMAGCATPPDTGDSAERRLAIYWMTSVEAICGGLKLLRPSIQREATIKAVLCYFNIFELIPTPFQTLVAKQLSEFVIFALQEGTGHTVRLAVAAIDVMNHFISQKGVSTDPNLISFLACLLEPCVSSLPRNLFDHRTHEPDHNLFTPNSAINHVRLDITRNVLLRVTFPLITSHFDSIHPQLLTGIIRVCNELIGRPEAPIFAATKLVVCSCIYNASKTAHLWEREHVQEMQQMLAMLLEKIPQMLFFAAGRGVPLPCWRTFCRAHKNRFHSNTRQLLSDFGSLVGSVNANWHSSDDTADGNDPDNENEDKNSRINNECESDEEYGKPHSSCGENPEENKPQLPVVTGQEYESESMNFSSYHDIVYPTEPKLVPFYVLHLIRLLSALAQFDPLLVYDHFGADTWDKFTEKLTAEIGKTRCISKVSSADIKILALCAQAVEVTLDPFVASFEKGSNQNEHGFQLMSRWTSIFTQLIAKSVNCGCTNVSLQDKNTVYHRIEPAFPLLLSSVRALTTVISTADAHSVSLPAEYFLGLIELIVNQILPHATITYKVDLEHACGLLLRSVYKYCNRFTNTTNIYPLDNYEGFMVSINSNVLCTRAGVYSPSAGALVQAVIASILREEHVREARLRAQAFTPGSLDPENIALPLSPADSLGSRICRVIEVLAGIEAKVAEDRRWGQPKERSGSNENAVIHISTLKRKEEDALFHVLRVFLDALGNLVPDRKVEATCGAALAERFLEHAVARLNQATQKPNDVAPALIFIELVLRIVPRPGAYAQKLVPVFLNHPLFNNPALCAAFSTTIQTMVADSQGFRQHVLDFVCLLTNMRYRSPEWVNIAACLLDHHWPVFFQRAQNLQIQALDLTSMGGNPLANAAAAVAATGSGEPGSDIQVQQEEALRVIFSILLGGLDPEGCEINMIKTSLQTLCMLGLRRRVFAVHWCKVNLVQPVAQAIGKLVKGDGFELLKENLVSLLQTVLKSMRSHGDLALVLNNVVAGCASAWSVTELPRVTEAMHRIANAVDELSLIASCEFFLSVLNGCSG